MVWGWLCRWWWWREISLLWRKRRNSWDFFQREHLFSSTIHYHCYSYYEILFFFFTVFWSISHMMMIMMSSFPAFLILTYFGSIHCILSDDVVHHDVDCDCDVEVHRCLRPPREYSFCDIQFSLSFRVLLSDLFFSLFLLFPYPLNDVLLLLTGWFLEYRLFGVDWIDFRRV